MPESWYVTVCTKYWRCALLTLSNPPGHSDRQRLLWFISQVSNSKDCPYSPNSTYPVLKGVSAGLEIF